MRRILVAAAALTICANAMAQEWTAQTQSSDEGKKYNSYLTNDWNDNLYIGVAAGASTRFTIGSNSDIKKNFFNPSIDVDILKWLTPCAGVRFAYSGINGREGLNSYMPRQLNHSSLPYKVDGQYVESSSKPGTLHYGSMLLHVDLIWNITNTVSGYKKGRFYNISAYFSGGYLKLFDNKTEKRGLFSPNYDREFTLGVGFYNTFRITDRWVATADLRFNNHASNYRTNTGVRTNVPSLTVGVAYNIFKNSWNDVTTVSTTVNEALESAKVAEEIMEKTRQENAELNKEVEKLNTELVKFNDNTIIKVDPISYAELKARAEKADLVMYFAMNQSTLNFSELYHLDNYVKARLEENPDFVFKVTGSADKGTGTESANAKLSQSRANAVKEILIKKYGIKESNIVVDSVVTDKHEDGAFDRCVLIEK